MPAKIINRHGEEGSWSPDEFDAATRDRLCMSVRVTEAGCWIWQGWCNPWGYGTTVYRKRNWMVHRLTFVLWKGPIQKGFYICHTCDNPPCCNPEHLWAGKSRENLKDCVAKGRHAQANRTVCVNGHPLTPENIRLHFERKTGKTKRHCKLCERARGRLKAGWPRALAFTLPAQPLGYKPIGIGDPNYRKRPRPSRERTT